VIDIDQGHSGASAADREGKTAGETAGETAWSTTATQGILAKMAVQPFQGRSKTEAKS
jgi:hypothetical protein